MTNQNPMTLPVYSDQAISRMFCDYVDSTNCKERHTAAAVRDYEVRGIDGRVCSAGRRACCH